MTLVIWALPVLVVEFSTFRRVPPAIRNLWSASETRDLPLTMNDCYCSVAIPFEGCETVVVRVEAERSVFNSGKSS